MKSHSLPRVDSPQDFYLGGAYAFVLFILLILLFFQLLQNMEKIRSFAMKQSTAVSVSLTDVPLVTSRQEHAPQPVPKPKIEPKTEEPPASALTEDISSLFSEVQTQKIVQKPKEKPKQKIDAKRIASLQKRIKTTQKRQPSATAEQVKKLSLVRPMQPAGGNSASGGREVNAYYAKIQATIYDHFFPPPNSEGSVALGRIWLSAAGKVMKFKVLRRSGLSFFDSEVDALAERLQRVTFEHNPKGEEAVLDVSLVSKE